MRLKIKVLVDEIKDPQIRKKNTHRAQSKQLALCLSGLKPDCFVVKHFSTLSHLLLVCETRYGLII